MVGKGHGWQGGGREDPRAQLAWVRTNGAMLENSFSSEPTINPADKLFQCFDLLLDPWLCKGVVILDAIQQLAHAPKAVSFNASQHVLR